MNSIDHILSEKSIGNDAYKVPKGYFDTLHNNIIKRVTEEDLSTTLSPKNTKIHFFKQPQIRYAVAACTIGIIFAVGSFFIFKEKHGDDFAANNIQQSSLSEQYVNDCMEYAMIDNDDIYKFLDEE